jgi:hypothetical protein
MRALLIISLLILIICLFYFPIENFENMPQLPLKDGSGNPLAETEMAKNMGSLLESLVPGLKVRSVEPEFTESDNKRLVPILRDEIVSVLDKTPMILQGNEMLMNVR